MNKNLDASLLKNNSSRRTFIVKLTETRFSNSELKRVWHEIFSFLFLSQISFHHGTEYPIHSEILRKFANTVY